MSPTDDPSPSPSPGAAPQPSVTVLLRQWRAGDEDAERQVFDLVYRELHRIAKIAMRRERQDHTLQTTALVNEAYVRLAQANLSWDDRRHFYSAAATCMRRVLVDHARQRQRKKRGGDAKKLNLDDVAVAHPEPTSDLLALDEALGRLAAQDARKARVVELFYFGGLSYDEIAEVVQTSTATVHRDLRMAKAWLYHQLQ